MTHRIERDSLGEKQVAHERYYGIQTLRAIENFPVSGLRPWRAFVWSMAAIKHAAADVNCALGLLDGEQQRFEEGVGHHVEDGSHISPRTNR